MDANRCCNFGRQKCDIKEAEKILIYKDLNNRNAAHVERKNKFDISNNRGKWNHLKITQKIPEQRTGKARNEGST